MMREYQARWRAGSALLVALCATLTLTPQAMAAQLDSNGNPQPNPIVTRTQSFVKSTHKDTSGTTHDIVTRDTKTVTTNYVLQAYTIEVPVYAWRPVYHWENHPYIAYYTYYHWVNNRYLAYHDYVGGYTRWCWAPYYSDGTVEWWWVNDYASWSGYSWGYWAY